MPAFVTIKQQYLFENASKPDIIIFPGGDALKFIKDENGMTWAKKSAGDAEVAMSVCTGARIPGRCSTIKK